VISPVEAEVEACLGVITPESRDAVGDGIRIGLWLVPYHPTDHAADHTTDEVAAWIAMWVNVTMSTPMVHTLTTMLTAVVPAIVPTTISAAVMPAPLCIRRHGHRYDKETCQD